MRNTARRFQFLPLVEGLDLRIAPAVVGFGGGTPPPSDTQPGDPSGSTTNVGPYAPPTAGGGPTRPGGTTA